MQNIVAGYTVRKSAQVYSTLYTVQCTLYIVQFDPKCTLYCVHNKNYVSPGGQLHLTSFDHRPSTLVGTFIHLGKIDDKAL